jgi:U2 small nuclear ribonucleoprotein B''
MEFASSSSGAGAILPHRTLFVSNLDDHISKHVNKRMLYLMFSEFGTIQRIVMGNGARLRGQAWITFEDTPAATAALRARQGFVGSSMKALKISFANKLEPVGVQPIQPAPRVPSISVPSGDGDEDPDTDDGKAMAISSSCKRPREDKDEQSNRDDTEANGSISKITKSLIPHHILVCEVPHVYDVSVMMRIFDGQCGLKDVRLVRDKGFAFIEFGDEIEAELAMKQLNGLQISPDFTLSLTFSGLA